MQADRWRYADTLDAVTAESRAYYLDSTSNATDVLGSGSLRADVPTGKADHPAGKADHYIYDPRDSSFAELESTVDPESLTDQRMVYARRGEQLIYHTAPFVKDTEVSGFFKFSAWIAIDQPDTDFSVNVYEIRQDGTSILLSSDLMRARYRLNPREPKLIGTREPLRYDFQRFTFVSREITKGSRLRLILAPVNSIYSQRNYNSDGVAAEESMQDARPVTVTLFHDRSHPSALFVPIGQPD
jgi:putative CocE/NonD family hydrolase